MAIATLLVGIISSIGGLIGVSVGGFALGFVVFIGLFLLLTAGAISFTTILSPTVVVIGIILFIVFALARKK